MKSKSCNKIAEITQNLIAFRFGYLISPDFSEFSANCSVIQNNLLRKIK